MNGSLDVLVVRGFAMREGRGKWACCYEVRLATARDEPLLYRGELHGRSFASESAAVLAAREAGEREALLRVDSIRAQMLALHAYCSINDG
ncbi:hypothetical protein BKK79_25345 [Cupriavidus sp. USMAA2-4]|uniref:Uncharacterized protein n=1 Tax=Cupriavidus malaysiensis TaxID=367825 RepID=A0ABM6FFE4_9BURK|nr:MULTISPECIES: hypothetical protein [Cupriavidus]AOY95132.1 hypothetical protein BKK79_25345 [Cupriavidus sp. USMAA2-4]AOZ01971.1 hypothetical protein BKK81_21750 [Cupriavidus sp. USMAHM13]AOZ10646.1 hypothetical protein BKK80_20115 [Cupriavidus malaysiensis]